MPEPKVEPKDLKTSLEQVVEISSEEDRLLNLAERELKREVIKIGPLGPISAIARVYLARYMTKPVEEKTPAERLRELERVGGVPYLMALREAGIARAAAEKARIQEVAKESERRRLERLGVAEKKDIGKG
ncbi:hypothetical protein C8F04DRAFT_1261085 [Mycena alexandri]|uniref:Uncharacterized protein n=1 Tax=Mycena alexandri TaxID=1745969 RepID=A0AAD6ST97_9AGAR|nr:hypothetical protein C8F04DRAFT_1261085 [Mycena alexandri]